MSLDSSSLSSSIDPSQDPDYYDPINPASPFYDPSLDPFSSVNPNAATTNLSSVIDPNNSNVTVTSSSSQTVPVNDDSEVDFTKARKRGLRQMQASQEAQAAQTLQAQVSQENEKAVLDRKQKTQDVSSGL